MLNKSVGYLQFIASWCKENPHFPLNQNKNRVFKAGIVSWNNNKGIIINQQGNDLILTFLVCDRVAAYTKDRLSKLSSLISKETPVIEDAPDSDDDMYHNNF